MAKEKPDAEQSVATPIMILWKNILLLPIVGILDSRHGQKIMERMLERIQEVEAKVIILDILGVAVVDSEVANLILKIGQATKLMGCDCITTGISPSIANTLVHLGIELKDMVTRTNLKDGLETAFGILGLEVKEKREAAKKTP